MAKPAKSLNASPDARFSAPIRHLIGVAGALIGCVLGFVAGEQLAYAIAGWTDRDIAELKDMLIWSSFGGGLVGLLLGVWLALTLAGSGTDARRIALGGVAVALVLDAGLMLSSFDWPKASGRPVVMYELRLPEGMPQPRRDKVDVVLWSDKAGSGCYVASFRREGERPVIAGSFVIQRPGGPFAMSLRLDRETEGFWQTPLSYESKPEKTFGPWQRIEFRPNPRAGVPPLPAGEYEVRYRVRKYM